MKNILLVAPYFFIPEDKDGINKINYHLLLEKELYKADFLSINCDLNNAQLQDEFGHVKVYNAKPNYRENFLQKIIPRKLRWILSPYPYIAAPKKITRELARMVEEVADQYDIIHISTLNIAPVIDHLSEITLKKVLLCPVDSLTMLFRRRYKKESNLILKAMWYLEHHKAKKFEKHYYEKVSRVLFVADIDRKYTINNVTDKCQFGTIYLGVDTDYYSIPITTSFKKEQIIFVGNMGYAPNSEASLFLIKEIMPELLKVKPNIKLYLLGGESDHLKKYANNNIIITGRVDDLRPYIQEAAAFVSPLWFGGGGLKSKILEAMASGKVVIGSPVSFESIPGKTHNDFIEVKNPNGKEWAKAIDDYFNSENSQAQIEENARQLICENFSWSAVRKSYSETYSSF